MREGLTLEEALALLAQGVPLWMLADLVPIALIEAGDYVLSRHESDPNAPLTFSRVRQTNARLCNKLVALSFTSASDSGTITTTSEHPFWTVTGDGRGFGLADTVASGETHSTIYATRHGRVIETGEGWAFAIDLRPGDKLASPEGIGCITVARRKPLLNTAAWVYNLDVEGTHTYFVSPPDAPDQCIWVHNAKPCPTVVEIDAKKYPEAAKHLEDAGATNKPLTVDRKGAAQRRKENMKDVDTVPGKDRDEAPPACTKESKGASVRHIDSGDNRGAGGSMGRQIKDVPDGGKIVIKVKK